MQRVEPALARELVEERRDEWRGTCEQFSEAVARACMERPGLRGLAGCVLTYIASFGETCFQTYTRIAEVLDCHPESVGRCMRWLASLGYLDHTRIGPGKRPRTELARFVTPHGTTENRILPQRLGVKRIPKASRSRLRTRAAEVLAPIAVLAAAAIAAPRHSAAAPGPVEFSSVAATPKRTRAAAVPSTEEMIERRRLALEALRAFEAEQEPDPPE